MVKMPSVTIQITPQVADYLQRLVATGLWGKNVHEAGAAPGGARHRAAPRQPRARREALSADDREFQDEEEYDGLDDDDDDDALFDDDEDDEDLDDLDLEDLDDEDEEEEG